MIIAAGHRIFLTPHFASEADEMYAAVEASRDYLARWLPWAAGAQRDDILDYLRRSEQANSDGTGLFLTVRWMRDLVGAVSFNSIDKENEVARIGYWLSKSAQGNGVMARSVAALVDHGFAEIGLHRQEIHVATENRPSRRIPERLGFREDGTLREVAVVGEERHDHVVYGMLVHEWEADPEDVAARALEDHP